MWNLIFLRDCGIEVEGMAEEQTFILPDSFDRVMQGYNDIQKLQGLDHFIINTVRRGHHISHFGLEAALRVAERVGAKHTWLTHLSHQLPCHAELASELPSGIQPAFDGLTIVSQ